MKSSKRMRFLNLIIFILLSIIIHQSVPHLPLAAAKDVPNSKNSTSNLLSLEKTVFGPGDELNSLNSTSNLVSSDKNYTLGFFTIPNTNFTYLGIWNTKDDQANKAWVANRDKPMVDSGTLKIDSSGTLKVINGGGITLFNVSDQVGSGNTRAVLQDSGNLVVYDATTNQTLWQSFDHPTDSLLPGMKLGYNLTTGQNWTLTSWLSDKVPSSGAFTLSLEQIQGSGQIVMHWRGKVYWTSGPWNNETFEYLGSLVAPFNRFKHKLSLISDAGGMFFTFQTIGTSLSMLKLTPEGEINDAANSLVSTPYQNFCYGYQSNDGCAVSALPTCRDKSESFQLRTGDWIGGSSNYDDNSSITLNDCMEKCWNDCTCAGFATSNNGTGCITWLSVKPFKVDETGQAVQKYVLVSQKPPKKKTWIWIVVSLAIVLTSALAACLCYMKIRRRRLEEEEQKRRDDYIHQLTGADSFNYRDELEKGGKDGSDVKIFSLGAILAATDNFSDQKKLGQGGYGPVYKGELLDGREIAVKRLSKASGQGVEEFKSELILISKLQHTNLVRLLGCCINEEEKMLIYEFMANKSLDFFLFAEDKKERLDWQMRFNIIEGIAQGLLYLHKYSRMRVIHRDMKASNVLLDENMNPKIADFGMARIFQQNETEAMTLRVVGTYGYMAPEYAMEGTFSIKSDVFSFGVLILEIVSGRRNSSLYHVDRPLNLVGYAWELWEGGRPLELKDPVLGESCDVKQLLRTINVGLLCVQEQAEDRPTMSQVISMLNNEIADLASPKQPAFFTGRRPLEVSSSESRSTERLLDKNLPVSVNSLTLTVMEPR